MDVLKIKQIIAFVLDKKDDIEFNHKLFEIREGNLEKYLKQEIRDQIDAKSVRVALQRRSPINVLPKIVDKLSKVYSDGCNRLSETDPELVSEYEKQLELNTMQTENVRNYNSYKSFWLEIYIDEVDKKVKIRPIPSYEIVAYSESNDDKITHVIRCMGDYEIAGKKTKRFWIYTDQEFVSVTSDGEVIKEDMVETEGVNPLGVIPFIYRRKSVYMINPIPDYDLYCMVILIAILYTDLNFASMFSHHGIIYTIDVDQENLKISPDTIWNLKSEVDGKNPSVNILRPQSNTESDLMLLKNQISTWLYTRNIKPSGALSNTSSENFSSGIALLIAEMDTTEYRKELSTIFKEMEESEFWKKLAIIHNYGYSTNKISSTKTFSNDVKVSIDFPEIQAIEDRATTIANIKSELELRLLSRKDAIKRLYPKMDDKQIEERLKLVDKERENASEETMENTDPVIEKV